MTQSEPIRVVVDDDHTLLREGIREILEMNEDILVEDEAGTSPDGIAAVAMHRPDVVLLDVELPGGEVTDTVEQMRKLAPRTQITILSMYDAPQLLRRLINGGIRGYLLKSVGRQDLVVAIRSVYANPGNIVLSVSQESLTQMHTAEESRLSRREQEILELVAQALSNGQVATRLGVTEATVKRHLRNIFVKFDAVSRIDAVNKGIKSSAIRSRR